MTSSVLRSGTGSGLFDCASCLASISSGMSDCGIVDSIAFESGLVTSSPPRASNLFSAIDWTAFLDFFVPNVFVNTDRDE